MVPAFNGQHEQAAFAILRLAGRLGNTLHRVLKDHGISESGYWTLRVLRDAGKDGRRAAEIAEALPVRVPDVTRLVDRLERERLATRQRSKDDARAVSIRITAAGRTLLRRLDKPIAQASAQGLEGLSATQLRSLLAAFDKLEAAGG